jgi:hypothetical protein
MKSNLHVIGSGDDPILSGDELRSSDWQVAHFERFDLKQKKLFLLKYVQVF